MSSTVPQLLIVRHASPASAQRRMIGSFFQQGRHSAPENCSKNGFPKNSLKRRGCFVRTSSHSKSGAGLPGTIGDGIFGVTEAANCVRSRGSSPVASARSNAIAPYSRCACRRSTATTFVPLRSERPPIANWSGKRVVSLAVNEWVDTSSAKFGQGTPSHATSNPFRNTRTPMVRWTASVNGERAYSSAWFTTKA